LANFNCSFDVKTTVTQKCEGKAQCNLTASNDIYGNPCSNSVNYHLDVTYGCASAGE